MVVVESETAVVPSMGPMMVVWIRGLSWQVGIRGLVEPSLSPLVKKRGASLGGKKLWYRL